MALKLSLKRRLTTGLLFVCTLGIFAHSNASATQWTVNGTFANGNALTGNFDFDATTAMVSDWSLSALGYTYTPADSTFSSGECCTDQFDFMFSTEANTLTLDFAFNPDLTNAGGTSQIAGGAVTFSTGPDRPPTIEPLVSGTAVSGIVPPPTVPEPGSFLLVMCGGLLVITLAVLRSSKSA